MKLKAKGFPIGIGLAHHDDSRASWRAIMWSFGGSEVAKDGKTITYNSKEVREALKFNKALYKDAMTPEVLAWDDASNNRLLASGRGSWIHNPISAYRTIEGQNKELADKIWVQLSPKGPVIRRSFANCRAYGITKFSKNPDGSKAFLEALVDNYKDGFRASTGYDMPFLRDYAKGPYPDHQRGSQAEAARAGHRVSLHHRVPGPPDGAGGRGLPAVRDGRRPGTVLHGQDGPRADGEVG